jgi:hypothetical protein
MFKSYDLVAKAFRKSRDPSLSVYGVATAILSRNNNPPIHATKQTVYVSCLVRTWQTAFLKYVGFTEHLELIISPFLKEKYSYIFEISNTQESAFASLLKMQELFNYYSSLPTDKPLKNTRLTIKIYDQNKYIVDHNFTTPLSGGTSSITNDAVVSNSSRSNRSRSIDKINAVLPPPPPPLPPPDPQTSYYNEMTKYAAQAETTENKNTQANHKLPRDITNQLKVNHNIEFKQSYSTNNALVARWNDRHKKPFTFSSSLEEVKQHIYKDTDNSLIKFILFVLKKHLEAPDECEIIVVTHNNIMKEFLKYIQFPQIKSVTKENLWKLNLTVEVWSNFKHISAESYVRGYTPVKLKHINTENETLCKTNRSWFNYPLLRRPAECELMGIELNANSGENDFEEKKRAYTAKCGWGGRRSRRGRSVLSRRGRSVRLERSGKKSRAVCRFTE